MAGRITMSFDADDAKLIDSFLKIENKEDALLQKTKQLTAAQSNMSNKATRGNKKHSDALSPLIKQYFGLQAAIQLATKAYAKMNEEKERAASNAKETDAGMGSLAQLAGNSQELRRMVGEARKSMTEQGMTRDQAGALQFALQSSGKGSERKLFSSLHGMADSTQMLEAVNTIQGSMGLGETGKSNQVLDKLFRASSGTKTNVGDLAMAAAAGGKMTKMVGGTDEELLSTIAVLARGELSADVASTQVQGLAAAAAKSSSIKTGGGLIDIVKQIQGKNLDEQGLYKLLGRKEAVKGFLGMQANMGAIQSEQSALIDIDRKAASGAGDYTAGRVRSYQDVFAHQRGARIAGARASLTEEGILSADALEKEAGGKYLEREMQKNGTNVVTRGFRSAAYSIGTTLGATSESMLNFIDGTPGGKMGKEFSLEMAGLRNGFTDLNATLKEDRHAAATDGRQ